MIAILVRGYVRLPTRILCALATVLTMASAVHAAGSVLYVDDDAPAGGDGQSWSTAFRFLTDALTTAADPERAIGEIRIAEGSYRPDQSEAIPVGSTDRASTFHVPAGIACRGAYAGIGAADPDARDLNRFESTLSGQLGGLAYEQRCFHVVTMVNCGPSTALDGLVIEKGGTVGIDSVHEGCGIRIEGGNPTLIDCTIRDNWVNRGQGGGVAVLDGNATFTRCLFQANLASRGGGGLYARGNVVLVDCEFRNHEITFLTEQPEAGAAIWFDFSIARLERCLFADNDSEGRAGAAWLDRSEVVFVECTFDENHSDSYGGAISCSLSDLTVNGCDFVGNWTLGMGGSIDMGVGGLLTATDCTFIDNSANSAGAMVINAPAVIRNCRFLSNSVFDGTSSYGAAMRVSQYAIATISNCLFSGQHGGVDGATIYADPISLELNNCTFTNNVPYVAGEPAILVVTGTTQLNNCILWNNGGTSQANQIEIYPELNPTLLVHYSDVQGWTGSLGGVGNFGANPLFIDADGPDGITGTDDDDCRLLPGSPCIDAGDSAVPEQCGLDLDGGLRRVDDPAAPDVGIGRSPLVDLGPYERLAPPRPDCDLDALDDPCAVAAALVEDCNANGLPDFCDVDAGASVDCNFNRVPDECELFKFDCNGNGVPDDCDIGFGTSLDCNGNDTPDECDIASGSSGDCNLNDTPDDCEHDCNDNGVPDDCDLDRGTSLDVNGNGVPDECEAVFNQTQGLYFGTIPLAVAAASDGDVVVVQPGIYVGPINFGGTAVTLVSAAGAATTILSGPANGPILRCVSGEGPGTVIDGFTITGGVSNNGGGMICLGASPTVRNCRFIDNLATTDFDQSAGFGGALYCTDFSGPALNNCHFQDNHARLGGAIACREDSTLLIESCVFIENSVAPDVNGGGVGGALYGSDSMVALDDCQFLGNVAEFGPWEAGSGGAVWLNSSSSQFVRSHFESNNGETDGGGARIIGGSTLIRQCRFLANTAGEAGGALWLQDCWASSLVDSCLFAANSAQIQGGALRLHFSSPRIVNCTIVANAASAGGAAYIQTKIPQFYNCIMRDNFAPTQIATFTSTLPLINHCNITGGFDGWGNFDRDPLFVAPQRGDYGLAAGSPCIDSGDPYLPVPPDALDLQGNDRLLGCRIDMGAFEAAGIGADCDADRQSDGCELLSGVDVDTNDNVIPDVCEIAAGKGADCNRNGLFDSWEVSPTFVAEFGHLQPFDYGMVQVFTLSNPPAALGNVIFKFAGVFPSSSGADMSVSINGVPQTSVFNFSGAPEPQFATWTLDAATYNQFAATGAVAVSVVPTTSSRSATAPGSFIALTMSYAADRSIIDCNGNQLIDECELADGTATDCNRNGILDECDLGRVIVFELSSGLLAPLTAGVTQHFQLQPPAAPIDDVSLMFAASSDLGFSSESVAVQLNGTPVGVVFGPTGDDCANPPDQDSLTIPLASWQAIVGSGPVDIAMIPSAGVDGSICGASFIECTLSYFMGVSVDQDGDGILDECRTGSPDLNGDGVVNGFDLAMLLGVWGVCPKAGACPADLNGDGAVNGFDLAILLGSWG